MIPVDIPAIVPDTSLTSSEDGIVLKTDVCKVEQRQEECSLLKNTHIAEEFSDDSPICETSTTSIDQSDDAWRGFSSRSIESIPVPTEVCDFTQSLPSNVDASVSQKTGKFTSDSVDTPIVGHHLGHLDESYSIAFRRNSDSALFHDNCEPDQALVTENFPLTPASGSIQRKFRRVGPDGDIFEDILFVDADAMSNSSSRRGSFGDGEDLPCAGYAIMTMDQTSGAYDQGQDVIQVYTETLESEPTVDQDFVEYNDTLPDGTQVKRSVTKRVQKQTIINRVLVEGPPSDDFMLDKICISGDGSAGDSILSRYTDTRIDPTQIDSFCEEQDEVLPDGTVVRRRIVTTSEHQVMTERSILMGEFPFEGSGTYSIGEQVASNIPPIQESRSLIDVERGNEGQIQGYFKCFSALVPGN